MTSLQPYPKYKDSGLPWVGSLPSHWQIERAKWLYQKMARPVRDSDDVVTCFRDGIVTLRTNRRTAGFTNSLKEIGYQGVRNGDLVIHAMDAFAGSVGVSDSDGKCTPVYSVCTAKTSIENRYYAYLVRQMARSQWILCLARGIRERSTDFRFQSFGAQPVPLPPQEEQRAIADYLDANAAKVRRFIRNRRRLIEVLNEQKQAIINRAVTRGLDPNAPLKPSGIDWLGDIPEHWEVVPLRWYIRVASGDFLSGQQIAAECSSAHPYPIIGGNGVLGYTAARNCDEPTIVIGRVGALCGNVHYIDGPAWITDNALRLSHIRSFSLHYLALMLRTMNLNRLANANAQPLITGAMVKSQVGGLPNRHEQVDIVNTVRESTVVFDKAIGKARREIDLIREYRTRLIADVVTGKVDVRHLAPPPGSEDLDEMVEELEPLDDEPGELDEITIEEGGLDETD